MSWKKTDLERLKAASITDQLRKSRVPARYGRDSAILGWQKQFKQDEQAITALVAARTRSKITNLRMLGKDAAIVDVSHELEGGTVDAVGSIRRGSIAFVVRKEAGRWRIAAKRSIPER